MFKSKNNKAFSLTDSISWNQPEVRSKLLKETCHVFYATIGLIRDRSLFKDLAV